jgi:hypothetical protein
MGRMWHTGSERKKSIGGRMLVAVEEEEEEEEEDDDEASYSNPVRRKWSWSSRGDTHPCNA